MKTFFVLAMALSSIAATSPSSAKPPSQEQSNDGLFYQPDKPNHAYRACLVPSDYRCDSANGG